MPSISYLVNRIRHMSLEGMKERIAIVHQKTNRPKILIFLDMVWCGIRYGAGYVDYDVIGFYQLHHNQRKTMLTRGINNKFVKQLNEKEYWYLFDRKNEFNTMFSQFVTRSWLYPVSEKKVETMEWIQQHPIFFAKPNAGQCGKGIEKIQVEEWKAKGKTIEELYDYLVESQLELLEEPIRQHEKMNALNPSSINTIRMVSVMNTQKKVTILTAFSRIGNGSHVDNFNSGGMTAKIDVATGRILEEAVNKKGEVFEKHPTTGTTIKGFQIPFFEEAKEMVKQAAQLSEHVRYIGWDVAITPDGPTLVEGNQFPGHDIYQVAEKMEPGQLGVLPEFRKAIEGDKKSKVQKKSFIFAVLLSLFVSAFLGHFWNTSEVVASTWVDVTGMATATSAYGHNCNNYAISKYDGSYHWMECSICSAEFEKLGRPDNVYLWNPNMVSIQTNGSGQRILVINGSYGYHSYTSDYWAAYKADGTPSCTESNLHYYVCNCGYSFGTANGRPGHIWGNGYAWNGLYHTVICEVCRAENGATRQNHNHYGVPIIGCQSNESCTTCGYVGTGKHNVEPTFNPYYGTIIGGTACKSCSQVKVTGFQTLGVSNPRPETASGAVQIYLAANIANVISFGIDNPDGLLKNYVYNYSVSGNCITINYSTDFVSDRVEVQPSLYFPYELTNVYGEVLIGMFVVVVRAEVTPPQFSSVTSTALSYYNNWATGVSIHVSGTENYCSSVSVQMIDQATGIVVYSGNTPVNGTWFQMDFMPNVTADANGKTYIIKVTDTLGNENSTSIVLSKIDRVAPAVVKSGQEYQNPAEWGGAYYWSTPTNWSQTKDIAITATDEGSQVVNFLFQNVNGFQDIYSYDRRDTSRYPVWNQKDYTFTGNVNGFVTGLVTFMDDAGNTTTDFLRIYNLDNIAPTISIGNKVTESASQATSISALLQDADSGIRYFGVTTTQSGIVAPSQWVEVDTTVGSALNAWYRVPNSNSVTPSNGDARAVTVTMDGLWPGEYYFWTRDLAGNVSYVPFSIVALPAVTMADYTYADRVSVPQITNSYGTGVTYYYNTTGVNNAGYVWDVASMTATSLSAGMYYMYAVVGPIYGQMVTTAPVEFHVWKANIMASTVMSDYTYAGAISVPSVNGNLGGGSVTYYYTTLNQNSGGNVWDIGSMTSTSLNVGTYYMYATVGESTNYNGTTTAQVPFQVNPATITGSVTITGTNTYGQILTANTTVSPTDCGLSYQWYHNGSNSTSNGTAIPGATGKTYQIGSGLVNEYIYVVVTASKTNYTTTSFADVTDGGNNGNEKVQRADFTPTVSMASYTYAGTISKPSVSGNTSGGGVTYYYTTLNQNSGGSVWDVNTMTSTSVDVNTYYMYAVVAQTADYNAETTAQVQFKVNPATITGSVTITGTNTYGQILTANTTVSPTDCGLSYQWYHNGSNSTSNGTAIPGATGKTYQIGSGLVNEYIYVVVTASKTNYTTASFADITDGSNNGNEKVQRADFTPTVSMASYTYAGVISKPSVSGNTSGGGVTYYYTTLNQNSGGSVWDVNTMTSTSLNVNTYYMYAVVAQTADYNSETTAQVQFKVNPATITGSVTITGTNIYGQTLTANTSSIRPTDCTLAYQWYFGTGAEVAGSTTITGATGATYRIGDNNVSQEEIQGKKIFVKVTASRANYITATFEDKTDGSNNQTEEVQKLGESFITKWSIPAKVDGNGTTIELPMVKNAANAFVVAWGDGIVTFVDSGTAYPITHTYTNTATTTYRIAVTGTVKTFGYDGLTLPDKTNTYQLYYDFTQYLVGIEAWGNVKAERLGFAHCTKLDGTIPAPLGSKGSGETSFASITSMENMFYQCTALDGPIPASFTEAATNMASARNMFYGCQTLQGSIPADLFQGKTKIQSFAGTFQDCKKLSGSIPESLFAAATANTSFAETFANCESLTAKAGDSLVIPMGLLANHSKVTSYYRMFYHCTKLTGNITQELWNTFASLTPSNDSNTRSDYRGMFEESGVQSVELTIPVIARELLKNCSQLDHLLLTNTVTLQDESFYGCNELQIITIDSTQFKTIGQDAFEYTGSNPELLPTWVNRENEVLLHYNWTGDRRVLDFEPPTGTVTILADKYPFTNTRKVMLQVTVQDNRSLPEDCEVAFVNEDDFRKGVKIEDLDWKPYQPEMEWTLSDGDGEKIVYLFVRDEVENTIQFPQLVKKG